ncbi:MAG: tetratricopeptide repeat protein [Ignavibacteriales bacterium]|nr:tetratricopeptide repeat protein [Ignavibacteria bacterium]MBZ0196287.1 tetratricopeptide repeat protein [Ignavibacteriaceae bacterium]MCZ2142776.1 tetratricopeptide repeat protein [Ignavibacteriales bacterium]WKZ71461.1 MAG: tetratricopeptide repeat protein [Ignavibacteriaceae bacterium]
MKFPVLLILFLLPLSFINAQGYEELNKKVQNSFGQGQYGLALVFAEQAAEAAKKEFGETDSMYAKALNNLAMIYQRRLRFFDAERTFLKTLQIKEKSAGKHTYSYSTTLVNLADLYKLRKNFPKALEYYKAAEEIDRQILGRNHPEYATDLANIGRNYYFVEEYDSSVEFLTKAIDLRKNIAGEDDANYSLFLVFLADTYNRKNDFEKADSLYKLGLKILSYKVGTPSPLFLNGLRQLSSLYKKHGDIKTADSLIVSGLSIAEARYTRKSQQFIDLLADCAELKLEEGDLVKAEEYALEVYTERKLFFDEVNPTLNNAALFLAKVYFKQGRFEDAAGMIAEYFGRCLDIKQLIYPGLSITDIKAIEEEAELAFGLFNSIYLAEMESNRDVRHLAFNNFLILSSLNAGKYWFNKSKLDEKLLTDGENDYSFWFRHAEYYSGLRLLTKQDLVKWNENVDTIYKAVTTTTEKLAKDSLFSATFYKLSYEWQDYQKTLQNNEATVVFLRGDINTEKYPGEVGYGALVLKGGEDDDPQFIRLKNGNDLEQKIYDEYKKASKSERSKLYSDMWAEISPEIKGKTKLLIKKTGVFSNIDVENIFDKEKGATLDKSYSVVSW